MKRKDTQVYRKLINKYCVLREKIERAINETNKFNNIIHEKELLKSEQTDSRVISEINQSIQMFKFAISCQDIFFEQEPEMKKYEEILINEYGDNPDIIYKNNKYNF